MSKRPETMNRELTISILDQALMSGFSLALNLVLIALATPEEFGLFVIVLTAMLIIQAVQNALVTAPLNILLPGRDDETQRRELSMLSAVNRLIIGGTLIVACLLAAFYATGPILALAIAFYLAMTAARDYTRDVFVVRGQVSLTFAQDIVYAVAAICGIALAWRFTDPVTAVVAGLGAGNVVALAVFRPGGAWRSGPLARELRAYRRPWSYTRWALLSGMQTEAQSRGYVFITEAWKGAATLGMLQVGRLLLAPMLLIAAAWGRIARPRMVAHFHNSRPRDAFAILGGGVVLLMAMSLVYGAAIAAAWAPIEEYIFRGRYGDMRMMAFVWWLYTAVAALNSCGATLLEVQGRFRALAMLEMVTAASCLGVLLLLSLTDLPATSVVITLVVVQVAYGIGMLGLIFRGETAATLREARMGQSGVPL